MSAYIIIFFLTSLLAVFGLKKLKGISTIAITLLLVLFAGTRESSVAPDYKLYEYLFSEVLWSTKDFVANFSYLEYCFIIIPNIIKAFIDSNSAVIEITFLVFALLGVSIKMWTLYRYSSNFFLSVFLYFGFIFLMSDMITIRAGVASGLFFLSLFYIEKKEYKKILACFIGALLFHYSSVVCLLIYFLLYRNISYKNLFVMAFVGVVIAIAKLDIVNLIGLGRFFPKIELYNEIQRKGGGDQLNLFNFRIIFSLLITAIFFINYKKLKVLPYFDNLFKTHIISMILFFVFSTLNMTFSIRTFEFLTIVQLVLFPYILNAFPRKLRILPYALLIAYGIGQYYYLIDYSKLFSTYDSWLFKL